MSSERDPGPLCSLNLHHRRDRDRGRGREEGRDRGRGRRIEKRGGMIGVREDREEKRREGG